MERLRLIAAVAIAASALSLDWGSAMCAGAEVELDPSTARPGDTVVVSGHGFIDGDCDDSEPSGGCWGGDDGDEDKPREDIRIEFRGLGPRSSPWRTLVDDIDARADGTLRVEVTVPDLAPGAYAVNVEGGYPKLRLFIPPPGS
jgi:hypothetical protein